MSVRAVWAAVTCQPQKSHKDPGEPRGLQMVAFLEESEKHVSFQQRMGCSSQPTGGRGTRPCGRATGPDEGHVPYGTNEASGLLGRPGSARGALTLQLLEPPFQLVVVVRHLPRVARRQRSRDAGRPLQFHYARRPPPTPIQLAAASARPGSAPCEAGWASGEPHPGRKATG